MESAQRREYHPVTGGVRSAYVQIIPPAWRALAALCYLSEFLSIPVLFPFVIWMLYPRSRFLRGHALVAGMIQAIGLAITGLLKTPSFLFLIEENQFFMTPEQYAGAIFSADQAGTIFLLVLLTIAFITLVILPGIASGRSNLLRRRRPGGLHVTGDDLILAALLAALLTPILFYMQGIWGPMSGGGFAPPDAEGQGASFFGLHLKYFENPYRLFPGHIIQLWSMTGLILAVRGKLYFFSKARSLFIRFQRESRATGEARYRAARWRALALPGWGQFYAGHRLAGLVTAAVLFLVLLFWLISVGLNYGRLVADIPGLNANFAWNILSDLGMRAHLLSDGELRDLLGNWPVFAILSLAIGLLVLHSRFATRLIFARDSQTWNFFPVITHSILLHVIPLTALLIIPVTLLPLIPASGGQPPSGIPQEFEQLNEEDLALNGSAGSTGEESDTDGNRKSQEQLSPVEVLPLPQSLEVTPGPDPALAQPSAESEVRPDPLEKPDPDAGESEFLSNAETQDEESPLKGKRKKQTYSNYLSVKIRAPEKDFRYWDQLPRPYSAVFEYHIEADGRVHSVRIAEASEHAPADQLTVRLIESMGTVLPPPGDQAVVVTELFWNTGPDDPDLPTRLQQQLSREFDGRLIEPAS